MNEQEALDAALRRWQVVGRTGGDGFQVAARAARRLRAARLAAGLSLSMVQFVTNIPASTVGSYERQERWFGNPQRLGLLCAVYGITMSSLFADDEGTAG